MDRFRAFVLRELPDRLKRRLQLLDESQAISDNREQIINAAIEVYQSIRTDFDANQSSISGPAQPNASVGIAEGASFPLLDGTQNNVSEDLQLALHPPFDSWIPVPDYFRTNALDDIPSPFDWGLGYE